MRETSVPIPVHVYFNGIKHDNTKKSYLVEKLKKQRCMRSRMGHGFPCLHITLHFVEVIFMYLFH